MSAIASGEYDSSFSAKLLQNFLWKDGKPFNYKLDAIPRTQDLPLLYEETSGFYIYKNENVAVEYLFTGCERQLFIFDCCRSNPLLLQDNQDSYYFASNEADTSYLRNAYKEKYDSYLKRAEKGIIQIFSCDVCETAQDWDRRGGMFSYNFIQSAKGNADMTVKDVFDIAEQRTIKTSGSKQHPQIYRPRSGNPLPFYIA